MDHARRVFASILPLLFLLTLAAAAQISIAPANLTFKSQVVSSTSAPQTITLTNLSKAPLTVSSVAVSGGYASTHDCSSMQPGGSCTIDVTFISGLLGTSTGVVTIIDSDRSSPQTVNLSGTTVPPLTLSPAMLSFGTVAVGTTSQPKEIKITRTGGSAIAAITASGNYAQSNDCPVTLPAGQSCTVSVEFVPTSVGTISGALSVSSFDGTGFAVALSGTGAGSVVSQISVHPKALNFGRVAALDLSRHTKAITVSNVSATTSLTIQRVSVTGPTSSGSADYQIASNTCKGMLAPGAQCKISVSLGGSLIFPSSAPGAVTIVDSDVTSPQVVSLAATLLPEVGFTPPALVFAPQPVGTASANQIVTITNNSDLSGLSLLPLAVSGDFVVDGTAGSNPCGLAPGFNAGQSCTLGVSFAPNHTGPINGEVSFTLYPECDPERVIILHEPCPASQTINLKGTGQ